MAMTTFEILVIALGLAMDAFAVSLGARTHEKVRGWRAGFRLWFHFGLFQSLMTLAGWFTGAGLEKLIARWDHWLAFGLLALVGGKMIKEGFAPANGEKDVQRADPSRGLKMVSLSVATSLDALAVGVTLGVLRVPIWYPGVLIGVVTALLSLLGLQIGQFLGNRFGRRMEMIGGVVLVLIAIRIVFQR
jgi:manganese efflux pump family protein